MWWWCACGRSSAEPKGGGVDSIRPVRELEQATIIDYLSFLELVKNIYYLLSFYNYHQTLSI